MAEITFLNPLTGKRETAQKASSVSSYGVSTPEKSEQTYTIQTKNKQYTIGQKTLDWIRGRYKQSFDGYYGFDDEDQYNKANGIMPRSFQNGYGNNDWDRQLLEMGLPSSKYLDQYLEDYHAWYGDGQVATFNDDQVKYIQTQAKKDWKYTNSMEDLRRKNAGEMPLAMEKKYKDDNGNFKSYADEMYFSQGLPPTSELGLYMDSMNTYATQLDRTNQFYNTVGEKVLDLELKGIKYDDTLYTQADGTQTTGKKLWEQAYNSTMDSDEWGDVRSLIKVDPLAKEYVDQPELSDTENADRRRVREEEQKRLAEKEKDDYIIDPSWEQFYDTYKTSSQELFQQKLATDAADEAYGAASLTLEEYANEAHSAQVDAMYAGITDKAAVNSFIDSREDKSNLAQIVADLAANGVSRRLTRYAKNELLDKAKTKEEKQAIKDAFKNADFSKEAPRVSKASEENIAAFANIIDVDRSSNYGTVTMDNLDDAVATLVESGVSKEEAVLIANNYVQESAILVGEDGSMLERKEASYAVNEHFGMMSNDQIDDTYMDAIKDDWKIYTEEALTSYAEAESMFMGQLKFDEQTGVVSEESLEAAVNALVEAKANPNLIESVAASVISSNALLMNDGVQQRGTTYIMSVVDEAVKKADAARRKEFVETYRAAAKEKGVTDFAFDQMLRRGGWDDVLDDEQAAYNYFFESGFKENLAAYGINEVEFAKLSDEQQNLLASEAWALSSEQFVEDFKLTKDVNADIHKNMATVVGDYIGGRWLQNLSLGIASGTVGLADLISGAGSDRDQWEITKNLAAAYQWSTNYGKTNQSTGAKAFNLGTDVVDELLRMFTLNKIGSVVGGGAQALAGRSQFLSTSATQLSALSNASQLVADSAKGFSKAKSLASSSLYKGLARIFDGSWTAMTPFMANATGNYFSEAMSTMRQLGNVDRKAATTYALTCGVFEGAVEKLNMDMWTSKALGSERLAKSIKAGGGRITSNHDMMAKAIHLVGSTVGEFGEESTSYLVTTFMQRQQFDPTAEFDYGEMIKQGLMGALIGFTGAALGSGSYSASNILAEYNARHSVSPELMDAMLSAVHVESMPSQKVNELSKKNAWLTHKEYASTIRTIEDHTRQLKTSKRDYFATQEKIGAEVKLKQDAYDAARNAYLSLEINDPNYVTEYPRLMESLRVAESELRLEQAQAGKKLTELGNAYQETTAQHRAAIEKAQAALDAHHVSVYQMTVPIVAKVRGISEAEVQRDAAESQRQAAIANFGNAYRSESFYEGMFDALDAANDNLLGAQLELDNAQSILEASTAVNDLMDMIRSMRQMNPSEYKARQKAQQEQAEAAEEQPAAEQPEAEQPAAEQTDSIIYVTPEGEAYTDRNEAETKESSVESPQAQPSKKNPHFRRAEWQMLKERDARAKKYIEENKGTPWRDLVRNIEEDMQYEDMITIENATAHLMLMGVLNDIESGMSREDLFRKSLASGEEYDKLAGKESRTDSDLYMLRLLGNERSFYEYASENPRKFFAELTDPSLDMHFENEHPEDGYIDYDIVDGELVPKDSVSNTQHIDHSFDTIDLDDDAINRIVNLGQKLGRKVVVENLPQGTYGYYDGDGVLHINRRQLFLEAGHPEIIVFKHELTHSLETSKKYYNSLKQSIFDYARNSFERSKVFDTFDEQYEVFAEEVAQDRAERGLKTTKAIIEREFVAAFAQDRLFSDEAAINALAEQNSNLWSRTLNKVRYWLYGKAGISGTGSRAEQDLKQIERLYAMALQDAGIKPSDDVRRLASENAQFSTGLSWDNYFAQDDGNVELSTGRSFYELGKRYGVHKQGANPRVREGNVPLSTDGKNRTSKFINSYMESPLLADEDVADIMDDVVAGLGAYTPKSNKESAAEAQDLIVKYGGLEKARAVFSQSVATGNINSTINVLGLQLLAEASARKDAQAQREIAADLAVASIESGRGVQVFYMLKKMGAAGAVYYMTKLEERLNAKYADAIANGKMQPISIPTELMDNLANAKNNYEIEAAEQEISKFLGQSLPLSFGKQLQNWRYFSMLANPTTHIRNITGNALMYGARNAKNAIAAGLESAFVSQEKRTHAVYSKANHRAEIAAAEQAWRDNQRDLTASGGKYGIDQEIAKYQRSSSIGWLDNLMNKNFEAMETEDRWFLRATYIDAYTQYLVAQGIDPTNITKEQAAKAHKVADAEARAATFRDASKLATWLNSVPDGAAKLILQGALPFVKTPINVAKRGVEYSPAGLIKGVYMAANIMAKGDKSKYKASEAVDRIASGATGTGLLAIGVWLASAGILKGIGKEEEDIEKFLTATGDKNYSMTFSIDNEEYTMDMSGVAPINIPLFMGVTLYEAWTRSEDSKMTVSDVIQLLAGITDPMMEMSFLSSLDSALTAYNSADSFGGSLGAVAWNAAKSYGSQFLPTFGGKVADFIDPTQRTTAGDATSPLGAGASQYLKSLQAKIPFATFGLEAKVDVKGETNVSRSFGDFALDFANAFILPAKVTAKNRDYIDNELLSIAVETGNTDFLPAVPTKKYIRYNNTDWKMNARQFSEYTQELEQQRYAVFKKFTSRTDWNSMDAEQKAALLESAIASVDKVVKEKYLDLLGAYDS